jgi:hypothetical protein
MIMKKFEYKVIAHIEDEDDIVEVCDEGAPTTVSECYFLG